MTENNKRKLITIPNWNKHHEWPSMSGLRYLIFHANTNGFNSCIVRAGRRILIDEARFFEWLDNQQGGGLNETRR